MMGGGWEHRTRRQESFFLSRCPQWPPANNLPLSYIFHLKIKGNNTAPLPRPATTISIIKTGSAIRIAVPPERVRVMYRHPVVPGSIQPQNKVLCVRKKSYNLSKNQKFNEYLHSAIRFLNKRCYTNIMTGDLHTANLSIQYQSSAVI